MERRRQVPVRRTFRLSPHSFTCKFRGLSTNTNRTRKEECQKGVKVLFGGWNDEIACFVTFIADRRGVRKGKIYASQDMTSFRETSLSTLLIFFFFFFLYFALSQVFGKQTDSFNKNYLVFSRIPNDRRYTGQNLYPISGLRSDSAKYFVFKPRFFQKNIQWLENLTIQADFKFDRYNRDSANKILNCFIQHIYYIFIKDAYKRSSTFVIVCTYIEKKWFYLMNCSKKKKNCKDSYFRG